MIMALMLRPRRTMDWRGEGRKWKKRKKRKKNWRAE